MTKEVALSTLINIVTNNLKHQDYKRVTDLAKDYDVFMTGDNVDTKLKRFNPREDEVMFTQRKILTISTTPAVTSSIQRPFNKVPRTPPVTKKIAAKGNSNEKAVTEIQDRINKFYGGDANVGGLDYWMQNRFVDLSFIDPNSWVVIEFDPFNPDIEKPSPRPFEVTSEQAINFSIINNLVQWLIVETDIQYPTKINADVQAKSPLQPTATLIMPANVFPNAQQSNDGKKYTMYADEYAVTLTQTSDNDDDRILPVTGEQILEIEGKGTFIVNYYDTKTNGCPAFRVGYIPDIKTQGRTYVNPFNTAMCHLEGAIKTISEFDLSKCLHIFPQKVVRLTKSCEGFKRQPCRSGRLPDGTICPTCKGSGRSIHTSAQDVIEVQVPEQKEDLIPLNDYMYYVPLPVELLQFLKGLVDDVEVKCHQTVFNSTSLLRKPNGGQRIDPTATEVNNDMESVYDTLAPFGEKVSSVWVFIVQKIAVLTDNFDKVTILHRFPSNFKLKTRIDLYNERKMLNDAGSPPFVLDAIDDELAQDIYADDADSLLHYRIKKEHFPFPGKSFTDIQFLLTATTTLKKTKVLYTYFDQIFTELQRDSMANGSDFYLLKPTERQDLIDKKVSDIITELGKENQTAFSLLNPPTGQPQQQINNN